MGRLYLLLPAAGLLLAAALAPAARGQTAALHIDADITGNNPRAAGPVDGCVSAAAGRAVDVDLVLSAPGVPAGVGLAAFQYTLFFDPDLLTLTGDDVKMLMAQAPGSRVVAFSEPLPNTLGEHRMAAVDNAFGVEPDGASETGPGVLARLTFMPRGGGLATIVLRDVSLRGDQRENIQVESGQQATIAVGRACDSPSRLSPASPSPSPSPAPSPSRPAAASANPGDGPAAAAPAQPVPFAETGGRPGAGRDGWKWLLAAGVAVTVSGAVMFRRAWRGARPGPAAERGEGR